MNSWIKMINCKDCIYGKQKFCCEGCDIPSSITLGSCSHFKLIKSEDYKNGNKR